MKKTSNNPFWVVLILGSSLMPSLLVHGQNFNEAGFKSLVNKLEQDVTEFAQHIEELHASRCTDIRLFECARGNYDNCQASYPNQECMPGKSYHIPACGVEAEQNVCSALYDFSVSTVSLTQETANGANGNPTDPLVIETICYTQAFDQWVRNKMKDDEGYWKQLRVEPSSWYFGSHTGAFRIWPARQSINCHDYDTRLRPWYVAASSGPKNIVMVLDTSRSMFGLRMELLKDAAKRVVNTLTVGDRIAIVPFSTDPAQPLTDKDGYMLIATRENKDWLINQIDKLEAGGRTNFYDAFVTAFNLLAMSVEEEYTVNCNTAILFLTDGEMTEPKDKTEQDVLDFVSSRISDISTLLGKPVMLFTYSVSEQEEVHALPSRLACTTEWGVWSKVTADVEIVESLASYYRLFALGLGANQNNGFAAWVEPYAYYTGGVLGTTVSTPVYDRSKQPHVFLGVAAVDLRLAALDAALGIAPERGSQESINRIALVSTARCPTLELELCELESFRRNGAAGNEALCTTNCTEDDFVQIEEESCPFVSQYPSEVWANDDYMGLSYEDRVCCLVGESFPSDQCPLAKNDNDDSTKTTIIIGSAVGGGVLLILCACVYWFYGRDEEPPPPPQIEAVSEPPQIPEPELESAASPKEPGTNASRTLTTEDHSSS